jgi:hypothetical protein
MKTMFTNPSKGDVKQVRRHIHRYWVLVLEDTVAFGQPWLKWSEQPTRSRNKINTLDVRCKYVLDVIAGKVIHSTMSLRELEMMNKRSWPLREKMLEAMGDRQKAKKSKLTMERWAKETVQR